MACGSLDCDGPTCPHCGGLKIENSEGATIDRSKPMIQMDEQLEEYSNSCYSHMAESVSDIVECSFDRLSRLTKLCDASIYTMYQFKMVRIENLNRELTTDVNFINNLDSVLSYDETQKLSIEMSIALAFFECIRRHLEETSGEEIWLYIHNTGSLDCPHDDYENANSVINLQTIYIGSKIHDENEHTDK